MQTCKYKRQARTDNEELIDTLIAISVVSKRLAEKLSRAEKRKERKMSQIKELSAAIDALISCGEALTDAAKTLKDFYTDTSGNTPEVPASKEPEKTVETTNYTLEQVRAKLAAKAAEDEGKCKMKVKSIVQKYSSTGTLKGIPEESFEAVIREVEGL